MSDAPNALIASCWERTACIHCDLPVVIEGLDEGQRASCPRCGHLLSARVPDGLQRSLAFAVAAGVLLALASSFPFLSLQASGLETVTTLPGSAIELHRNGYTSLAVLVLLLIIGIPALMLATVVALIVPLVQERSTPFLVPAARLLFMLTPWSMVEVFIIGVIVSLVKIGHMATVVLGLSFWSYVAFSLCFTACMASLDRLQIWHEIERCSS